jgi:hypothetical protein
MRRPGLFWGAWAVSSLALDAVLDRRHNGSTLSEVTRATFRTHHPVGRAVFLATLAVSSAGFARHICKRVEGSLST